MGVTAWVWCMAAKPATTNLHRDSGLEENYECAFTQ
jgi:hypothetical protein